VDSLYVNLIACHSTCHTASLHVVRRGAAEGAAVVCGALVGMYGMADEIDRQRRVGPELRGDALWEVRQLRNRICATVAVRPVVRPRFNYSWSLTNRQFAAVYIAVTSRLGGTKSCSGTACAYESMARPCATVSTR
jgi:hypothetical protein